MCHSLRMIICGTLPVTGSLQVAPGAQLLLPLPEHIPCDTAAECTEQQVCWHPASRSHWQPQSNLGLHSRLWAKYLQLTQFEGRHCASYSKQEGFWLHFLTCLSADSAAASACWWSALCSVDATALSEGITTMLEGTVCSGLPVLVSDCAATSSDFCLAATGASASLCPPAKHEVNSAKVKHLPLRKAYLPQCKQNFFGLMCSSRQADNKAADCPQESVFLQGCSGLLAAHLCSGLLLLRRYACPRSQARHRRPFVKQPADRAHKPLRPVLAALHQDLRLPEKPLRDCLILPSPA